MVMIPTSPGPRVGLQNNPTSVAPMNPTAIGNAIQELGQTGVQAASQQIAIDTRRNEALQSAKSMEYSMKIRELDNELELQAQQTPSTPKDFTGLSERISLERQKRIDTLLAGEQDPVVKNLTMRDAQSLGIEFKDRVTRQQLSKEMEYGQHVISTKLDSIGDQLANTSDPRKIGQLNKEIKTTLSAGLASRYINYDFIEAYHDKVKRITAARAAEAAQAASLNAILDGKAFADPNSAKDRKMIDGVFDKLIKSEDPELQAKAIDLSARTGIVPSQLVSTVSGRLTVGTPEQKAQAAQIISQLISKNPRLVSAFPQTIQGQALEINRSIEAGIPVDQAIAFSEKNIEQNKSFDRQRREETFKMDNAKKIREGVITSLQKELADVPFSFKTAEIPDEVAGQFEYLTKQFYMNTGASYEDATAHAKAVIKSQWKITDIGGRKKLQRYSPESQYLQPGQPKDWIKNQLLDTLSGKPEIDAQPEGLISLGNIDLSKTKAMKKALIQDGESLVLVPFENNGKTLSPEEALRNYKRTGQNFGTFESEEDAARYTRRLSVFERQQKPKSSFLGEGKFIADFVERTNYFPGKTPEQINEEIELAVDPASVSTGLVSYFVTRPVDEYGRKEVILDENNQPLKFTPDFSQTEAYKSSRLARDALKVGPEVFAERLYQERKSREKEKGVSPTNARSVSLIGGQAF